MEGWTVMDFKWRLEAFIERERLMPLQQETKEALLDLLNAVDTVIFQTGYKEDSRGSFSVRQDEMDWLVEARQELEKQ
jgi:hypothetical protein